LKTAPGRSGEQSPGSWRIVYSGPGHHITPLEFD